MSISKILYRLNDKWLTTNPKSAYKQICSYMLKLDGIHFSEHLYGSTAFMIGNKEIGHIHGNKVVDIRLPKEKASALIKNGIAKRHKWTNSPYYVSIHLSNKLQINKAIEVLTLSYEEITKANISSPTS